jgi:hypothetical protein
MQLIGAVVAPGMVGHKQAYLRLQRRAVAAGLAIPTFTKNEAVKKPRIKIVTTFSSENFALGGSINDL